ncbi:hypothetical protein EDF23_102449 [Curtobacterium sp. PhB128]|uniref:DUF6615 family protein n=2 Tax=unclassified Curtobacterium TaxID=257496 RepID=UPI000F956AA3|nr:MULTISPECIES: DUF6615 family protein [unclassified Curtobacterium]ROQ25695.1 hypothetical protein EDF40_2193 [Curtobacterium sp. PhB170]TCL80056.1 hypothetical protein EDF23_102449 [Curtobacterium sp. PhB128]ROQ16229.1 hypothetical protein EDF41_0905 [Curtobacterium sp. PhB171]ROS37148.1 hypothetical protein EDF25_1370 [Curtobacterium sp. PhB131]ROS71823.1 hypothetical protein EDF30_1556 [Curtobacterium sp. PhB141]
MSGSAGGALAMRILHEICDDYGMKVQALAQVMDELAELTWFKLVEARRLTMRMGEVSITDHNLLALQQFASAAGSDVRLVHAHDEATSGADFEIWLVDRAGRPVWAYSIQAKVGGWVGATYKYRSIGHKVGPAAQHDLLLRHAATNGTRPFHLLYNGWDPSDTDAPIPPTPDQRKLGCAAVSTHEVARIRRLSRPSLKAVDYLPKSFPWSELLTRLSPPAPPPVKPTPPISPSGGSGAQPPLGGGAGPGTNGNGAQGGSGPSDGDSPSLPAQADAGLDIVRPVLADVEGESASPLRRPSALPEYVLRGLDGPRTQVPRKRSEDVWLPEFALVVTID